MHGDPSMHGYIRQIFGRESTRKIFTVGECQSIEKDIVEICGEKKVIVAINFDREQTIDLPVNEKEYKFIMSNFADYKEYNDYFRAFEIAVYEEIK